MSSHNIENLVRRFPTEKSRIHSEKRQILLGLGPDWWKQVFDGDCIHLGKYVFDTGAHELGSVESQEPGYYSSIEKAHNFILGKICSANNCKLYRKIHRKACSHFNGISTLISADYIGSFDYKTDEQTCAYGGNPLDRVSLKLIRRKSEFNHALISLKQLEGDVSEIGIMRKEELKNFIEDIKDEVYEEIWDRNQYIQSKSKELGLAIPIARIRTNSESEDIRIVYNRESLDLKPVVKKAFNLFNKKIKKAYSDEEKLKLIADLFQTLEWIHPFPDGQGRTDLILLNKLLVQYGFNPAILEDPYFSTFSSLEDWVEYLKIGMEKWRNELQFPTYPTERVIEAVPSTVCHF